VRPYVLDYKPDLLIIGGLSNGGDAESVRSVIRQVRAAADPTCCSSSTADSASTKPTDGNPASFDLDPQGATFRDRFRQLAIEERVEFFDVHTPWTDHLRELPPAFHLGTCGYAPHQRARAGRSTRGYWNATSRSGALPEWGPGLGVRWRRHGRTRTDPARQSRKKL